MTAWIHSLVSIAMHSATISLLPSSVFFSSRKQERYFSTTAHSIDIKCNAATEPSFNLICLCLLKSTVLDKHNNNPLLCNFYLFIYSLIFIFHFGCLKICDLMLSWVLNREKLLLFLDLNDVNDIRFDLQFVIASHANNIICNGLQCIRCKSEVKSTYIAMPLVRPLVDFVRKKAKISINCLAF